MSDKQKLELTWIGKDEEIKPEPRILLYDKENSYGDENTENMLIHGDNLLALKALEKDYAGKIKCIYIDPPYNTGSAFEHYDDNLEHTIWLGLMKVRLEILRNLLSEDGIIFVQIDDNEQAYLKVMLDEIFGRNNFMNVITVKTKIGGVSGSSEGKSLKDVTEFINMFAKRKLNVLLNPIYNKIKLFDHIKYYKSKGKSWKYTSVLTSLEDKILISINEKKGMKFYGYKKMESMSIKAFAKVKGLTEEDVYNKYADKIYQTTNAQSSVRQTVIKETEDFDFHMYGLEYTPIKGKNANKEIEILYKGVQRRMMMFLSDSVEFDDEQYVYLDKVTTLWDDMQYNNLTKEGNVQFPNGKKPEGLIERILTLATNEGDLILDSFLGSGTTAAVAHKMGRKYIGIELGEHCYTHCKPRLERIINNEDAGGISKSQNWQGGGGFKFYELAPSLLKKDKFGNMVINEEVYNANLLAAAVAKLNGYKYFPHDTIFWKQGTCSENAFILTTTEYVDFEYLDKISKELDSAERLLVCCPAFDLNVDKTYDNIEIKKIPKAVLDKCEYAKDNYNLNIIDTTEIEEDCEDCEDWDND